MDHPRSLRVITMPCHDVLGMHRQALVWFADRHIRSEVSVQTLTHEPRSSPPTMTVAHPRSLPVMLAALWLWAPEATRRRLLVGMI